MLDTATKGRIDTVPPKVQAPLGRVWGDEDPGT